MIKHRLLGNTSIQVSEIGLGTVKFGRNQGVKYPTPFELPNDKTMLEILEAAKQLGINLLDTAPAYGCSEERIGKYFKKTCNRHDWILASKFGENFSDGSSSFDFTPKAAKDSIDESLRRLQTDYLDIVLVHSNGEDEKIIEQYAVFDTLAELKKTGKIRAYGMSTKTIAGGLRTIQESDVAMITYNPLETTEQPIITLAQKLKKGILIKKALASGHMINLTNHANPIQHAIQFILNEPGVSSIIIGTLNIKHLEEIANYANQI